jgi:5-methylcytosine-specific restriction protein A
MGWESSNRKSRLPREWHRLRAIVLREANYQCEVITNGIRCTNRATEVDHIIAGDDHSRDNLRAICTDHHKHKSSAEGNAARKQKYSRRIEPHPGYKRKEIP